MENSKQKIVTKGDVRIRASPEFLLEIILGEKYVSCNAYDEEKALVFGS